MRRCIRTFAILSALTVLLGTSSLIAQRILVTYYSESGHTKAMAEAVVHGAQSVAGTEVRLRTIDKTAPEDLVWADAIIVGTPVKNANVAAPVAEAMGHWPFDGSLANKVGAAFVSAGGISAGEELTQTALLHSMLIFGMIVVGGPTWEGAFGASAVTDEKPFVDDKTPGGVAPLFLAKGEGLGKRVAEVARRWGTPKK